MKKDCRHLKLVPTVEEHKTRMENNQKSYAAPAMSSESRARVNQMRGCFEAEIILPDGKFQYFKPHVLNEKEAIQEIALFIEGIQEMNIGYVILWRFVGQQSFYSGTKIVAEPKFRKIMRKLKDYLFDYEELIYETEK
ncbi:MULTISPECIES: DUF6018 family natural product bioysynthesis protein [Bacillus cereus group]|uniref:DUF6018 family natural product bioysynthesis protein n=1 Tax=Bacillus cereus group TaxID=86661 RepID=UPI000A3D4B40|nr:MULTISPECIES: DUF6018 family natural product bioysynthesis protein [Bacillus cereus group]MCR6789848.1 DUF6018 family natural product bioysynthesis protein [Bacillus thuringiensis]MCR6825828.1 DUF6018 family natural product bioysynthesis protein [Bacillus thuringiensis]MCR6831680.1 DUF6018 family natural product bioysynthesis protein [Bacillus thuringiensis]MEB9328307.1 DUF6018 family natural product bioysynthesis protein [Bacillus cereus]MEB9913802.1 DUF6018 family natural product bioysynt